MKMNGRAIISGEIRETYVYDSKEEREKHCTERENDGWEVTLITIHKKNGIRAFHVKKQ